jgi:hypothetical protein
MKKMTLSAEGHVIAQAKRLARRNRTSVSSMFTRYIQTMAAQEHAKPDIAPIARRMSGILKLPKGKTERDVLVDALMEKYEVKP